MEPCTTPENLASFTTFMKGVRKILGNLTPAVGVPAFYYVAGMHTPEKEEKIKWVVHKKNNAGKWVIVPGYDKKGLKAEFVFNQVAYGQELLVEAYVYGAERKAPPGLIVRPKRGKPIIKKAEILGLDGNPLKEPPRYNDKILLRVTTENMQGMSLALKVYDEDIMKNSLLWQEQEIVKRKDGIVNRVLELTSVMRKKGGLSVLSEGYEHEYFLVAEANKTASVKSKITDVLIEERKASVNVKGGISKPLIPDAGNKPVVVAGEKESERDEKKCPRCDAEITLKEIEEAFKVYIKQKDFRQKIVDSLNKFIIQKKSEGKSLHLDTCLRKAHFFAQVAVETLGIHIDWIVEGKMNHSTSSAKTAFGDRAKALEKKDLLELYCKDRPQKRLLNYMYAKGNGFDNGNGVEESGDGWRFRGRGLKQITGRGNYRTISAVLKEIFPEEYYKLPKSKNDKEERLESDPEKVEEIDYSVTTAIAYWEKHKIWQLADQIQSKDSSDNYFIAIRRKVVGSSAFKWREAKDYFQKTFDAFRVNDCLGDTQTKKGEYNLYKIDYVKKSFPKVLESKSDKFQYEVYKGGELIKIFSAQKNKFGYLKFPESGPNWARYGTRDIDKTDGDNWITEKAFAALLGFFYSVAENGISEMLYYNDISAEDGSTNLGHSTHRTGKDIDIRYPGCSGAPGKQMWTKARDYWGSELKFDEIMKIIYSIAKDWNFVNNYHYKAPFTNTKGRATAIHQDHFHLGFQ